MLGAVSLLPDLQGSWFPQVPLWRQVSIKPVLQQQCWWFQDTFVESGGVATLMAVLHSPSPRAMQEAAGAIYTIVADAEENKAPVVADRG